MREICTYGSTRGLQVKVACDPVRSSRVRRNVLDHGCFFHLRSTLLVKVNNFLLSLISFCALTSHFFGEKDGFSDLTHCLPAVHARLADPLKGFLFLQSVTFH